MVRPATYLLLVGMLTCCLGCGGGDTVRKFHVSGKVTHKGVPVPYGTIIFDPDRSAGNSGPQGSATISDGQFNTSSGNGVVGGAYTIIVEGFNEKPNFNDESVVVKPLFPKDTRKAELPKQTTTLDIDIK